MLRRSLLLLTMLAGVLLIAWSGWHNLRQNRSILQLQQEDRADLVPSSPAPSADATATELSPLRGKPAPAFALVDLNGHTVSLSDFKGRPLLINFWGTYCPPCKIEMPWLQDLSKKYASSGFAVVGITYDSEVGKETIAKVAQKLGVTYPILLSDPKAEKDYLSNTEYLPMSFYVDRSGKVIDVTSGIGSENDLEAMVEKTIAAEDK